VLRGVLLDNRIASAISDAAEDSHVLVEIASAEGTRFRSVRACV
jgi:hypothetical protein